MKDSQPSGNEAFSAERLLLEVAGRDHVEMVREKFRTTAGPVRWKRLPPKSLIILFASRSGSSYAARLLSNTRYFKRVEETFNAPQLEIWREKQGLDDDGEAAQLAVAKSMTKHGFAAKCGIPGLIGAELTGFLDAAWDGISFVRIKRRDTLAQAVSILRAQLSGQYHSPQPVLRDVREEDYDRGEIDRVLDVLERVNGRLDRFVDLSGKSAPTFYYEDISARPGQFVKQALRHFGVKPPKTVDTEVRLEILRDEINAAWMERYRSGR